MKIRFILRFAILLIIATSCKSTIMRLAGVREPKIETKESIYKFLEKANIDTSDVYTIDSILYEKFQQEEFKPGMAKSFRPIQIRMYGKNGEPVMQWSSCEGFLSDLKIFDSVPPKNINGINTSLNLENDLRQYFTLDGTPAHIVIHPDFDYYFLIYFAKYFPKMSKESFSEVNQYIRKHSELKCKVYKINVDFLEFWNDELYFDFEAQIGGDK